MAAADCLDKANIITVPIKESYNISCSETDMPMVMHELNKSGAHIMATDFAEICNFRIEFDRANAEKYCQNSKPSGRYNWSIFLLRNSCYLLFLFSFSVTAQNISIRNFKPEAKLVLNDQNEVENYVLQFHPELFSSNSDLQLITIKNHHKTRITLSDNIIRRYWWLIPLLKWQLIIRVKFNLLQVIILIRKTGIYRWRKHKNGTPGYHKKCL